MTAFLPRRRLRCRPGTAHAQNVPRHRRRSEVYLVRFGVPIELVLFPEEIVDLGYEHRDHRQLADAM
jgi:hypothetical protein